MVLSVGGVVPIAGASFLSETAVPSLVALSSCWRRSSLTQVKSALSYKTDVFNELPHTPPHPHTHTHTYKSGLKVSYVSDYNYMTTNLIKIKMRRFSLRKEIPISQDCILCTSDAFNSIKSQNSSELCSLLVWG